MRGITLYFIATLLFVSAVRTQAQTNAGPYTINADTVTLTSCDSTELTLRNHSDTVPGFLFNNGYGHTIFKRGLQKLSNGSSVIGADTLNAWLQGGNKFGTTGILGTMDNNPLDFYSNGSQQMRLAPNGHMLFGSTSDNGYQKFQFTGSISDTAGYFANFSAPFIGANNSGAIRLRWGTGDGVYLGFYYQGNQSRRAYMATASDSRPFVISDQIGVTFLNTPFVCIGEEYGFNSRFCVVNSIDSVSPENDMAVTHTSSSGLVYDLVVKPTGHTVLGGQVDSGYQFQVNGTSSFSSSVRLAGLTQDSTQTRVLVSDANGNLYYRSASSLAVDNLVRSSLAVNGTIKSRKIIISPDDWADYVFDSTYRLPRLGEVESYIRREHHLPGIPSAADVRKDSLDVGAGQAALLKKIEELTLYTIEQDKKLDEQQRQIGELKAQVEMLIDKQGLNKHE